MIDLRKKNQEEEAVQEKNTAQDTAEEQVRDPEEKMQDPARTVRERVEAQLKCFEENKNVEEGLKLLRELLGDVVCMPVTMSMTLDALDSLNAGKDFNLDQAMDVKPDVIAVNGKERALPVSPPGSDPHGLSAEKAAVGYGAVFPAGLPDAGGGKG